MIALVVLLFIAAAITLAMFVAGLIEADRQHERHLEDIKTNRF